ncbi:MAG TPA: helix-turn-helix domain-containing protein [Candidatus Tumulicola sp.]|nr:helix-turn-helix domain-containing protein [Candidatus Tumulicola sp.]
MSTQTARLIDQANLASLVPSTIKWEQLERGRLEVAYGVMRAGPLFISSRTFNLAFHGHAQIMPGKAGLIAIETAADARWRGAAFDFDSIAIGHEELDVRTHGPSALLAVTIDENELNAHAPGSLDAADVVQKLADNKIVRNQNAAARLRGAIRFACAGQSMIPPALSGTLIPLLAATLEDIDGYAMERSRCLNRRYAAVRACETYMREHIDETVTLLDLSQLCGMRSRSLINAFEAITGFSPMHYLKRLRLSGANRMLQLADPRSTRVIDVATEWGFWHMGHFATDYRTMFGEPPSQTLSRR